MVLIFSSASSGRHHCHDSDIHFIDRIGSFPSRASEAAGITWICRSHQPGGVTWASFAGQPGGVTRILPSVPWLGAMLKVSSSRVSRAADARFLFHVRISPIQSLVVR